MFNPALNTIQYNQLIQYCQYNTIGLQYHTLGSPYGIKPYISVNKLSRPAAYHHRNRK